MATPPVQIDAIAHAVPTERSTSMMRFPTTRSRAMRRVVAGALGALLLTVTAACGGGADEKTASGEDKINFGVFPIFISLPAWVAQEQGFFKANKLAVEFKTVTSGPTVVSALASGSLDAMVTGEASVVSARGAGMPIKMLAVTYPTTYNYVYGSNKVIEDCEFLGQPAPEPMRCAEGKKVGIIGGLGSEAHMVAVSLLKAVGLKESDVTFVPIGGGEGGGNSLKEGQIDIQMGEDTAVVFTEQLGAGKSLMDLKTDGVFSEWIGTGAFAMEGELKKSPDKFKRLAASLDEAVAWLKDPANVARATEIFHKYSPSLDTETITKVVQNTQDSWGSDATCAQVMNVVDWLVDSVGVDKSKAGDSCDDIVWESANVTK